MVGNKQLRLVLVTPEKTLLDQLVHDLRFPLFDGQMGVYPGRAPLVGRLGIGELRFSELAAPTIQHRYFIDGGFVQIKGETVTILTNRAIAASDINKVQAEEQLRIVTARPAKNDAEQAAKAADLQRARQLISISRKS